MKKILITLISLLVLCACSSAPTQGNNIGPGSNNNGGSKAASQDEELAAKVQMTKAQQLQSTLIEREYEGIFTVTLPENWTITTGGADWYLWIRMYDPSDPNLQVFTTISTTGILKSQKAKEFYEWAYSVSGDDYLYGPTRNMIVNESGTMKEYFEDYMDYIDWIAKYDPTFSGFDFPLISNFQEIESWTVNDMYSEIAMDNRLIHCEYTEGLSQARSEGLFNGCFTNGLVMMDPGYDCGFYTVYNIDGISAPYGMLGEYQSLLTSILNSIEYSESWLKTAAQNQQISIESARQVNQIMQQTSQIIVDGWNQRQASYDRISQAYSDATLGYDRYYDTETGDVYRVEYGVMDNYSGNRYQLIENDSDLYSLPVTGYIYK
ncbi:MAG: hypothetical protein J6S38_07425 [Erysipelotrichaceae bacterium]|nr:hypothetical protein [Erysipelotrichaceae bacterium]